MKQLNETYMEALAAGRIEPQDLDYMAESADKIEDLEEKIIRLEADIQSYDRVAGELAALREFWVDCWYQMAEDDPAPSWSSDYDKSVMLETVSAGSKVLCRINELENDSNKTDEEVAELELLKGMV